MVTDSCYVIFSQESIFVQVRLSFYLIKPDRENFVEKSVIKISFTANNARPKSHKIHLIVMLVKEVSES